MVYPQNIEQKIDFQVIRDSLKGCCVSPLGKEKVDEMQWQEKYTIVQHLLVSLREMMGILSDGTLAFPLGDIYDLREALYFPGVTPLIDLNTLIKWLQSEKPVS